MEEDLTEETDDRSKLVNDIFAHINEYMEQHDIVAQDEFASAQWEPFTVDAQAQGEPRVKGVIIQEEFSPKAHDNEVSIAGFAVDVEETTSAP